MFYLTRLTKTSTHRCRLPVCIPLSVPIVQSDLAFDHRGSTSTFAGGYCAVILIGVCFLLLKNNDFGEVTSSLLQNRRVGQPAGPSSEAFSQQFHSLLQNVIVCHRELVCLFRMLSGTTHSLSSRLINPTAKSSVQDGVANLIHRRSAPTIYLLLNMPCICIYHSALTL